MLISKCPIKKQLTFKLSLDIMTNAWSLLYDELKMDEYPYPDNFGQETPGAITFNIEMNNDPNRYKYSEDTILKELQDYISGTYNAVSYTHLTLPTILRV